MSNSPKERSWFVNNWGVPEGMCYLGNTPLRTSPGIPLYIYTVSLKIWKLNEQMSQHKFIYTFNK